MQCLTTADLIPAEYRPSGISQPLRSGHDYRPDLGYRVYIDKALEIAAAATDEPPPLPQAGPARKRSKGSSASQEPA